MFVPVEAALPGHRKIGRLSRLLGIGRTHAVGVVVTLWSRVMTDCPGGKLQGWDEADLADAVMWEGDPAELLRALLSAGFLENDEEGEIVTHGWGERHTELLRKRQLAAERKRRQREKAKDDPPGETPGETPNPPITSNGSVTRDSVTVTRKRREEKKREENLSSSSPETGHKVASEKHYEQPTEFVPVFCDTPGKLLSTSEWVARCPGPWTHEELRSAALELRSQAKKVSPGLLLSAVLDARGRARGTGRVAKGKRSERTLEGFLAECDTLSQSKQEKHDER